MSSKAVKKELKDKVITFKTTKAVHEAAKALGFNISATLHEALKALVEAEDKPNVKKISEPT